MSTTRYKSARNAAFHAQAERCFYCNFPMWLTDRPGFAIAHGLTLLQASRLQATGEHLIAQQDGGRHGRNVVAACHHCNQSRHKYRPHSAPLPDQFARLVQARVKRRLWHPDNMFHVLAL